MLFCGLLIFFNFNFFEKFFQEYHQSVKQFGSRSEPTLCIMSGLIWVQTVNCLAPDQAGQMVGSDLDSHCLTLAVFERIL